MAVFEAMTSFVMQKAAKKKLHAVLQSSQNHHSIAEMKGKTAHA